MALDEALLDWHSEGLIPPVVDFMNGSSDIVDWLFSKVEKEINMEEVKRHDLGFVDDRQVEEASSMNMNLHIAS